MIMSIENLNRIGKVCKELAELNNEIKAAYNTYQSPALGNQPRIRRNASEKDPTVRALDKIEELRAKQARIIQDLYDFEDDMELIEDHEIRAIIRAHYINGDSWKECTRRVLGVSGSDCAKHRIYRFFHVIE